jgi:hypothetical protein
MGKLPESSDFEHAVKFNFADLQKQNFCAILMVDAAVSTLWGQREWFFSAVFLNYYTQFPWLCLTVISS